VAAATPDRYTPRHVDDCGERGRVMPAAERGQKQGASGQFSRIPPRSAAAAPRARRAIAQGDFGGREQPARWFGGLGWECGRRRGAEAELSCDVAFGYCRPRACARFWARAAGARRSRRQVGVAGWGGSEGGGGAAKLSLTR
jgi:hypothetical protein